MYPDFGLFAIIPFVMFAFVGLFVAAVFGLVIFAIVRNIKRANELGHDPFTLQTELAARAVDSELLAAPHSIESRLRELDDLRARKVITEAEYANARAETLAAG